MSNDTSKSTNGMRIYKYTTQPIRGIREKFVDLHHLAYS
jgi:hypothetical protein